MYLRDQSYATIPASLKSLAGVIGNKNNLLKKSKEENSLIENLPEFETAFNAAEQIGGELFTSFEKLQDDYNTGRINQVKYVESLKLFQGFFAIADLEKMDIPKQLNAPAILTEIAKYL